MKNNQPTLVLFCGLPGSGKTTIAKQLQKRDGMIRICTDDWMTNLGINLHNNEFRNTLQPMLYSHALHLLDSGVDVILEDGLWSKKERVSKLKDARKLSVFINIYVFDLSFNEQWRRVAHRNQKLSPNSAVITKEQLRSYATLFELPDKEELSNFDRLFYFNDDTPLEINLH